MAGVLLTWCGSLGLSRDVTDVDIDFRNGYLVGEILHKHNQQADFPAAFQDSDRADAIIGNYSALAPTMARLGIKWTALQVDSVVRGEPGVAARLLYSVYTRLQVLSRVKVGKADTESYAAKIVNMQLKGSKPAYETATTTLFTKTLRMLAGNQKERNFQMIMAVHEADYQRLVVQREAIAQAKEDRHREYLLQLRDKRLDKLRTTHVLMREKEETGAQEWAMNQTVRHGEEKARRAYVAKALLQENIRDMTVHESARAEALDGINEFEGKARLLGVDVEGKIPLDMSQQESPKGSPHSSHRLSSPLPSSPLPSAPHPDLHTTLRNKAIAAGVAGEAPDQATALLERIRRRRVCVDEAAAVRARRRRAVLASFELSADADTALSRLKLLANLTCAAKPPAERMLELAAQHERGFEAVFALHAAQAAQRDRKQRAENECTALSHRKQLRKGLFSAYHMVIQRGLQAYAAARSLRTNQLTNAVEANARALANRSVALALCVAEVRELFRGNTVVMSASSRSHGESAHADLQLHPFLTAELKQIFVSKFGQGDVRMILRSYLEAGMMAGVNISAEDGRASSVTDISTSWREFARSAGAVVHAGCQDKRTAHALSSIPEDSRPQSADVAHLQAVLKLVDEQTLLSYLNFADAWSCKPWLHPGVTASLILAVERLALATFYSDASKLSAVTGLFPALLNSETPQDAADKGKGKPAVPSKNPDPKKLPAVSTTTQAVAEPVQEQPLHADPATANAIAEGYLQRFPVSPQARQDVLSSLLQRGSALSHPVFSSSSLKLALQTRIDLADTVLEDVVHSVARAVESNPPEANKLRVFEPGIAVVGPPHSGVTLVGHLLADRLGYVAIHPVAFLHYAIQLIEPGFEKVGYQPTPSFLFRRFSVEQKSAYEQQLAAIAGTALEHLSNQESTISGLTIECLPDETWLEVIRIALDILSQDPAWQPHAWVLVDFPQTEAQAKGLEALSGRADTPYQAAAPRLVSASEITSTEKRLSAAQDSLLSPTLGLQPDGIVDLIDFLHATPQDSSEQLGMQLRLSPSTRHLRDIFEQHWPTALDAVIKLECSAENLMRRSFGWCLDVGSLHQEHALTSAHPSTNDVVTKSSLATLGVEFADFMQADNPEEVPGWLCGDQLSKKNVRIFHLDASPPPNDFANMELLKPIVGVDTAFRPGMNNLTARVASFTPASEKSDASMEKFALKVGEAIESFEAEFMPLRSFYAFGDQLKYVDVCTAAEGTMMVNLNTLLDKVLQCAKQALQEKAEAREARIKAIEFANALESAMCERAQQRREAALKWRAGDGIALAECIVEGFQQPLADDLVAVNPFSGKFAAPPLPKEGGGDLDASHTVSDDSGIHLRPGRPPLTAAIAPAMLQYWNTSSDAYASLVQTALSTLRNMHLGAAVRLSICRRRFGEVVRRQPHALQLLVTHYQRHHNDVGISLQNYAHPAASSANQAEQQLRNDVEVKGELYLRVEETAAKMWDAVDALEASAAADIQLLAKDGWLEHASDTALLSFSALLQAETTRVCAARTTLLDYYRICANGLVSDIDNATKAAAVHHAMDLFNTTVLPLYQAKDSQSHSATSVVGSSSARGGSAKTKPAADKKPPTAKKLGVKGAVEEEDTHAALLLQLETAYADGCNEAALKALIEARDSYTHAPAPTPVPPTTPANAEKSKKQAAAAETPAAEPFDAKENDVHPWDGAVPQLIEKHEHSGVTHMASIQLESDLNRRASLVASVAGDKQKAEKAAAASKQTKSKKPEEVDADSGKQGAQTSELAETSKLLGRLLQAVQKAFGVAEAIHNQAEGLLVAQIRTREKRIAQERLMLKSAIGKVRAEEDEKLRQATEAAEQASKANAKAAKDKPKGGATGKPVPTSPMPDVGAELKLMEEPQFPRKSTADIAHAVHFPSEIEAVQVQSAVLMDEGVFVALRFEVESYKRRVLVILRHAVSFVRWLHMLQKQLHGMCADDLSRSSLEAGACVEAFVQRAQNAIELGQRLPHPLQIERRGACLVFHENKTTLAFPHLNPARNNGETPDASSRALVEFGEVASDSKSAYLDQLRVVQLVHGLHSAVCAEHALDKLPASKVQQVFQRLDLEALLRSLPVGLVGCPGHEDELDWREVCSEAVKRYVTPADYAHMPLKGENASDVMRVADRISESFLPRPSIPVSSAESDESWHNIPSGSSSWNAFNDDLQRIFHSAEQASIHHQVSQEVVRAMRGMAKATSIAERLRESALAHIQGMTVYN